MSRISEALSVFNPTGRLEGKAVAPLPAIPGDRASAPEVFGHSLSTTAGSRYSGASAKRQLQVYGAGATESIDWVADALDIIADTAAAADWHFEDYDGNEVPRSRKEAEKHARLADPWLVMLLEQPNAWQSWEDIVKLVWIDKYITGDGFIYKRGESLEGHPLQLFRLAPYFVEVIPGKSGKLIDAYEYKVPGEPAVRIPPEKIIHWKGANPHDPYRGAGIIAKAPRVFDMEVALNETKAAYFENGARLTGVLESDAAISDSLATKLRRQFAGIYAGVRQAFQVAVLGRGLKYNAIQSSAKDAEFGNMTEQSRDRILAMLGVPRALLGLSIETSATTAPAEERRNFANNRMRPALNEFQTLITQGITSDFGLKFCIEFEYQMPIEDQYKLAGELAKAPGVRIEEVRERFGLAPLEGDKAELNDMVINLPGEDGNGSEVKDPPLPGEGGRPPAPGSTKEIKPGDQPKDAKVQA
jgi:HK97 family phage portal protein